MRNRRQCRKKTGKGGLSHFYTFSSVERKETETDQVSGSPKKQETVEKGGNRRVLSGRERKLTIFQQPKTQQAAKTATENEIRNATGDQ